MKHVNANLLAVLWIAASLAGGAALAIAAL
jgi:hypothetical protein